MNLALQAAMQDSSCDIQSVLSWRWMMPVTRQKVRHLLNYKWFFLLLSWFEQPAKCGHVHLMGVIFLCGSWFSSSFYRFLVCLVVRTSRSILKGSVLTLGARAAEAVATKRKINDFDVSSQKSGGGDCHLFTGWARLCSNAGDSHL